VVEVVNPDVEAGVVEFVDVIDFGGARGFGLGLRLGVACPDVDVRALAEQPQQQAGDRGELSRFHRG